MNTLVATKLFLTNRKALNRSKRYLKWLECKLNKFAAFSPELPTEPEPIEDFLITFPDEKDETRHGYFRALRVLYRFLYKRRKIPSNPFEFIDPPKRKNKVQPTCEPGEMLLMSILPKNPRDQAILTLLNDTGVRAGELINLQKQDIHDEFIFLKEGKEGERIVPISEETRRQLLSLVIPGSAYVFRAKHGGQLTYWRLYKIIRKYLDKVGVKGSKRGPHRLRHTFGKTYLEDEGADIRHLQKIMGHANIKTTQIYTNLANKSLIKEHHKHTPLRAIQAAMQEGMFDDNRALKQAQEILEKEAKKQGPL